MATIQMLLKNWHMNYKIKKGKRLSRSTGGNFLVFLFLGVVSFFMAIPLFYAVIQAFKPLDEIFAYPPRFFVRNPTFNNFVIVFQLAQNLWVPFSRYVFNSLFISIVGTATYVIIASLAAYPLAKHKFPGKGFIIALVIWSLLFRPEVTGVAQYIVISKLGMVDTYFAILLPALAGTFGVFLMKQFIL